MLWVCVISLFWPATEAEARLANFCVAQIVALAGGDASLPVSRAGLRPLNLQESVLRERAQALQTQINQSLKHPALALLLKEIPVVEGSEIRIGVAIQDSQTEFPDGIRIPSMRDIQGESSVIAGAPHITFQLFELKNRLLNQMPNDTLATDHSLRFEDHQLLIDIDGSTYRVALYEFPGHPEKRDDRGGAVLALVNVETEEVVFAANMSGSEEYSLGVHQAVIATYELGKVPDWATEIPIF